MDIAIIGGGASGMILASKLKKHNVTIFERNTKLGKKLLMTGNGKCNFTNIDFKNLEYIYNNDFAREVVKLYNNMSFINYLSSLGIVPKVEYHKGIGYVYPNSNKSSSVCYCLLDKIIDNNVKVLYNSKVIDIKKEDNKFKITCEDNKDYYYDKVVLATGGTTYTGTGSDGFGHTIASRLGHKSSFLYPGLLPLRYSFQNTSLKIDENKGFRVNAKVSVERMPTVGYFEEYGEVQFTRKYISGIPILNLSNKISRDYFSSHAYQMRFDFSVSLINAIGSDYNINKELFFKSDESSEDFIKKTNIISEVLLDRKNKIHYKKIDDFLCGFLPDELCKIIIDSAGISARFVKDLSVIEIESLSERIIACWVYLSFYEKNYDYGNAQITIGGIYTDEISVETMESKIVEGLYFTGEILDIDGICGGYNLQLCYSTASIAADALNSMEE